MVHQSIFILGRQPAIGRAELESLLNATTLEPIGEQAIACSINPKELTFSRLGGSVRLAKPLDIVPATKWSEVLRHVSDQLPKYLSALPPEGKLKLGLSVFGTSVGARQLFAAGLELKKACKRAGRSARVVPNTETELNSAQVLHNQLTGTLGCELLFIRDNNKTHIAQTLQVQDIDAYAKRDQGRPKRDARVGMLPPKLAQTIVNLAAAGTEPNPDVIVLDPFCGTGVILQEATLMGFGVYGTDLETRMVDYTDKNLQWLQSTIVRKQNSTEQRSRLEVGDATAHHWQPIPSVVACETYLGRPLSSWPNPQTLHEIMGACNVIIEKFLRNISTQLPTGTRLCLAIPAWVAPGGRLQHLSLLDHLNELGYNRVSFSYARAEEMVYYRPGQLVARELLVITRN